MAYKDWSDERKAEYKRRVEKIMEAHPDTFYPSKYHETMKWVCLEAAIAMWQTDIAYRCAIFPFGGWSEKPSPYSRKFAEEALMHAAALGDKELCENIHKDFETDINAKTGTKRDTALLASVERKRLQATRWLLEHGAKILPNKDGWNPVLWACFDACIPALNMFKHYGIDLNQPYSFWQMRKGIPHRIIFYPIEAAVCSKHPNAPKTVQWLLDNGVSIDKTKGRRHSIREILISRPNFFHPEVRKILARKATETPEPQAPVVQPTFWKRIHSLLRS